MKKYLMAVTLVISSTMMASAHAEGCLKGAAVGGVAGHFLGKHAVLGAIGGCAVGHHMAAKKEKEAKQQAQAQAQANRSQY